MTAIDLVTGADGFVGRHLVRHLVGRGRRVRALDLHLAPRLRSSEGVEAIEGDLTDPAVRRRALGVAAHERLDTIYHLAAAHLAVRAPEATYRQVNVEATRALAAESTAAGVRRFVHVSSVGVYGELSAPPADESTPCRPEHAYERTKLDGEAAVLGVHSDAGLPVVILRPAWIYGPGCGRTEKLFRAIRRRRFVVAGDGSGLRHGIFIDDFLDVLDRAAVADGAIGEVLLAADAAAAPVADWLATIARLVDAPPPPRLPSSLFTVGATAVEGLFRIVGREPPISRRTLRFFTANTAFDTTKIRRLLDFEPVYDLVSGLTETAERLALAKTGS